MNKRCSFKIILCLSPVRHVAGSTMPLLRRSRAGQVTGRHSPSSPSHRPSARHIFLPTELGLKPGRHRIRHRVPILYPFYTYIPLFHFLGKNCSARKGYRIYMLKIIHASVNNRTDHWIGNS